MAPLKDAKKQQLEKQGESQKKVQSQKSRKKKVLRKKDWSEIHLPC